GYRTIGPAVGYDKPPKPVRMPGSSQQPDKPVMANPGATLKRPAADLRQPADTPQHHEGTYRSTRKHARRQRALFSMSAPPRRSPAALPAVPDRPVLRSS